MKILEGRTLEQVGQAMGLSKDAANKRLSRALTRLRNILTRRGVVLPSAGLAAALASKPVDGCPAHLFSTVPGAALRASTAGGSTSALIAKGALHMMHMTQIKFAACIALAVIALAGSVALVAQTTTRPVSPQTSAGQASGTKPATALRTFKEWTTLHALYNRQIEAAGSLQLEYSTQVRMGGQNEVSFHMQYGVPGTASFSRNASPLRNLASITRHSQ